MFEAEANPSGIDKAELVFGFPPGEPEAPARVTVDAERIFSSAFIKKANRISARQAEEAIEEDCTVFEMTKPYLVERWLEK
jgi:hypothetical protein